MWPSYEVTELIYRWLTENAAEWWIDYGLNANAKPCIVRTSHYNPIAHIIHENEVRPDYRYIALRDDVKLNIADPEFFSKLKKVLKDCEETFNY